MRFICFKDDLPWSDVSELLSGHVFDVGQILFQSVNLTIQAKIFLGPLVVPPNNVIPFSSQMVKVPQPSITEKDKGAKANQQSNSGKEKYSLF